MEITVNDQKAFVVQAQLTQDQARERAWDQKMAAFGSFSRLLLRPKSDEIKVTSIEMRYDPLWHLAAHKRVVFDRSREFRVPVTDGSVRAVTLAGADYPVADAPSRSFALRGVEHCEEDVRVENTIHGVSGEEVQARAVLAAAREEITELGGFAPEGAVVVPPEVKVSGLVQRLVQRLITTYEADQVFEESIDVEHIHLLFHPIYAFEYAWEARGKKAVVELDAVTGDVKTESRGLEHHMKRIFNKEVLFDIGAETLNLVIPGGAIPLKIGKAIVERRQQKG